MAVISGESLDLSAVKANPKVAAILWQGYPGQSGAQALADAIYGATNPSGRLPITFYKAGYVDEVSMYDMGMRPNSSMGNPGRTYRFYAGETVYPFGCCGLSYTNFTVTKEPGLSLPATTALELVGVQTALASEHRRPHTARTIAVETLVVKNTGPRAGATSVLCYVSPPGAGTGGRPIKKLVGFDRVDLSPGQSAQVQCNITSVTLAEPAPSTGDLEVVAGTWSLEFGSQRSDFILE